MIHLRRRCAIAVVSHNRRKFAQLFIFLRHSQMTQGAGFLQAQLLLWQKCESQIAFHYTASSSTDEDFSISSDSAVLHGKKACLHCGMCNNLKHLERIPFIG